MLYDPKQNVLKVLSLLELPIPSQHFLPKASLSQGHAKNLLQPMLTLLFPSLDLFSHCLTLIFSSG